MTFVQGCIWGASACYLLAAIAFLFERNMWMTITMAMWACSPVTVWLATLR